MFFFCCVLTVIVCLFSSALIEMNEVPQQISLTAAKLGENVTLTCALSARDQGLFYWYKLNFGYMVQTVAEGSFDKILFQKNNSRFSATKVGNVHSLIIRNVSKKDEATYFCQAGSSFSMTFKNGTILAVNDPKTQNTFVTMKQTREVEPVHLSNAVTLQCSLLSKNKTETDQCPYGETSDSGTYYCTVVTCGQILFGEGAKLETKEFLLVTVLGVLLACSVFVNLALILTRKKKERKKKKQPREHCKGKVEVFTDVEQEKSSGDQMSNEEGEEVGLNYVALDFPSRKSSRWKSKKESPECTIYSGIREGQ
ncbi:uncharacterized protein LOC134633977 [Pelmatolapia mariae]|uniref:uncharacterized protein LOC134633977 n=1 Tax=Pelmatolapia mariae TaxID=158779 RepID=UPI002FE6574F